jgi:hypothetical protein
MWSAELGDEVCAYCKLPEDGDAILACNAADDALRTAQFNAFDDSFRRWGR